MTHGKVVVGAAVTVLLANGGEVAGHVYGTSRQGLSVTYLDAQQRSQITWFLPSALRVSGRSDEDRPYVDRFGATIVIP